MSDLPFTEVVRALRCAGNRAGALRVTAFSRALAGAAAVDATTSALLLARIAGGPAVDTPTVRELELEIAALEPAARSVAAVVAPALASLDDEAAVVHRALVGIVGATSAVFGAMVPWAVAVDATVLQACRDVTWDATRLSEQERAQELVRRIALGLGLPLIGAQGPEDPATSAKRLREVDLVQREAESRRRAIEQSIRSKLPKV